MSAPFLKRYFTLPPAQIAFLRFTLESYDGLAFARSLDGRAALVEIAYPPSRRGEAEALLAALTAECAMTEVPPPPEGTYPPL